MIFSPATARVLFGSAGVVVYSLAMHYALTISQNPDLAAVLIIAPFLLAALVFSWKSPMRSLGLTACALAIGLLAYFWQPLTAHVGWLYYLQHAGIYALLALMFGRTLGQGKTPLCTQFGVYIHDEMTERIIHYTRHVTLAWTLFFSATVALSTALFFFASFEAWSYFANVAGGPLIGAMFLLEFAVRCKVLPPEERGSLSNTWKVWGHHKEAQAALKAKLQTHTAATKSTR